MLSWRWGKMHLQAIFEQFNPLSAGIQFCKVLQGGEGFQRPPEIKQNEAKETCDR